MRQQDLERGAELEYYQMHQQDSEERLVVVTEGQREDSRNEIRDVGENRAGGQVASGGVRQILKNLQKSNFAPSSIGDSGFAWLKYNDAMVKADLVSLEE